MPLPLRDFYSTERAAELLGCELDDLVHWAMNGCIRLYVKIDGAKGMLLEQEIEDVINDYDFESMFKGTRFKDALDEAERLHSEYAKEIEDSDDVDENEYLEYLDKKRKIIYEGLLFYNATQDDELALNKIGLREFFSYLFYLEHRMVSEKFCFIGCEKYFDFPGSDAENITEITSDDLDNNLVNIAGFFALGVEFYSLFDLEPMFIINNGDNFPNILSMPESNLTISVLTDDEISFNVSDLYIFKYDFQKILKASEDGSEMKDEYSRHMISNMHLWIKDTLYFQERDKQKTDKDNENPPRERLSSTARSALRMLIEKHYPENKNKPSKLAEILSAEAREMNGFRNHKFDGETVARWLGLRSDKNRKDR